MKIIKPGKINFTITCDFCECVFEFNKKDIEHILFSDYKFVGCPYCGSKVEIKKGEKNETN